MSDFWDNVLGTPKAEPPQQPVSDLPWWQRTIVDVPAPQAVQGPPQPQQPAILPADLPPDLVQASLARTQWSRETTGNCPNCQSTNYSQHPEQPNARPRCFDCGYPLTQSGSGAAVQGSQAGPVKPSRQTAASKTNNFNPQNIFHHLG